MVKYFYMNPLGFTPTEQISLQRGNIFDLASITKTISTTSAVMNLVEENKLSLNDKVIKYVPELKGNQDQFYEQKSNTKIIDLMDTLVFLHLNVTI